MITCCAWCQKDTEEEESHSKEVEVSHGICEKHYLEFISSLNGKQGCGAELPSYIPG